MNFEIMETKSMIHQLDVDSTRRSPKNEATSREKSTVGGDITDACVTMQLL